MGKILGETIKKKWVPTTAWLIGVAALTAGLIYLMWFTEVRFRHPLDQFAWLAYLVVFTVTLLSSAIIIFPAPGVAVLMAAAAKRSPAIVAVVTSLYGTLGELT